MRRTTIILIVALWICNFGAKGTVKGDYRTVPLPETIAYKNCMPFLLDGEVEIYVEAGGEKGLRNAQFLKQYIREATGFDLSEGKRNVNDVKSIVLRTDTNSLPREGYRIDISPERIYIEGGDDAGVFYGIQQLRKSLPIAQGEVIELASARIESSPRFSYRGALLDTSRHFFTTEELRTLIDMMALHGMNRWHWHITDDQGWRLEIKKHPELVEKGSMRKETVIGHNSGEYDGIPYGGYYTQEEARSLVDYAAERYITIIPEIDLPGHMLGALAAYPELGCTGGPYDVWTMWGVSDDVLCAGNEDTYKLLEDIYEELIDIFPSELIHVGGDECPKVRWEKCPKCQAKIQELGLKDDEKHTKEERLQSHVINHMEKFLNARGRQIIGWDEILEGGLAPNAAVMSWRGIEGGIEAARAGHDVVMVPTTYLYLDYYQTDDVEDEPLAIGGYVPVEMVYSYEPVPETLTEEESKYIIGVQGNLWTEYVPTFSHAQYMLLPRWAALSETQWLSGDRKDYEEFLKRLPRLTAWYDALGYNYARHVFNTRAKLEPDFSDNTLHVALSTIDDSPIYYTLDGTEPTEGSTLYTSPFKISGNAELRALGIPASGRVGKVLSETITLSKASLKKIEANAAPNKRYGFDGVSTLVDGVRGRTTYKDGRWIGFYENDMDVTIDLGEAMDVSTVSFGANVLKGDWIFDAREVAIECSEDGEEFTSVFSRQYPSMSPEDRDGVYNHECTFAPVRAQYVRVKASPERRIPLWHPGADNTGFLFVDEITIQ